MILDEFHSGKKKIPVNRHRIPAVGDDFPGDKKKKTRSPTSKSHVWDADGRRHKKPKD